MVQEIVLPLQKPILTLSGNAESFIQNPYFPASIKDVKTGKYTACNQKVAVLAGLPPEEYCGRTAHEVQDILRPGHRAVTDRALEMDRRIITKISASLQYKHMWFTSDKSIFIEKVTKIPIVGHHNQVVAILAYGHDITHHADLPYLFSLYEHYHSSKEAIFHFLRHLRIGHLFVIPPTRRELIVLLTMQKTSNAKYVAKLLNISSKTVDENKARLRDKLRFTDLPSLLMRLRMRCEYNTLES